MTDAQLASLDVRVAALEPRIGAIESSMAAIEAKLEIFITDLRTERVLTQEYRSDLKILTAAHSTSVLAVAAEMKAVKEMVQRELDDFKRIVRQEIQPEVMQQKEKWAEMRGAQRALHVLWLCVAASASVAAWIGGWFTAHGK